MPKDLSIIVPAAGRSSRFKTKESKIFFSYKNKTLIEHVIDKVKDFTKNIIIISNIRNYEKLKQVIKKYKKYKKLKIDILLQKKPRGMGDAVSIGLSTIKTSHCAVIWADQIFLTKETIKKTINHFLKSRSVLCFPIFFKKKPYVYIKYKNKNFENVVQTREGGRKVNEGYSDCGFFIFQTKIVKKVLKELTAKKKNITKKTKEIDFLKIFYFLKKIGKISTIKANSIKDTKGVNFLRDLN